MYKSLILAVVAFAIHAIAGTVTYYGYYNENGDRKVTTSSGSVADSSMQNAASQMSSWSNGQYDAEMRAGSLHVFNNNPASNYNGAMAAIREMRGIIGQRCRK